MAVGVDESGGHDLVTSVDRLINRLVPASLRTNVNDVAFVGDNHAIPQMPVRAILICDYVRGVYPPPGHRIPLLSSAVKTEGSQGIRVTPSSRAAVRPRVIGRNPAEMGSIAQVPVPALRCRPITPGYGRSTSGSASWPTSRFQNS